LNPVNNLVSRLHSSSVPAPSTSRLKADLVAELKKRIDISQCHGSGRLVICFTAKSQVSSIESKASMQAFSDLRRAPVKRKASDCALAMHKTKRGAFEVPVRVLVAVNE
jgi:hypothetical protein